MAPVIRFLSVVVFFFLLSVVATASDSEGYQELDCGYWFDQDYVVNGKPVHLSFQTYGYVQRSMYECIVSIPKSKSLKQQSFSCGRVYKAKDESHLLCDRDGFKIGKYDYSFAFQGTIRISLLDDDHLISEATKNFFAAIKSYNESVKRFFKRKNIINFEPLHFAQFVPCQEDHFPDFALARQSGSSKVRQFDLGVRDARLISKGDHCDLGAFRVPTVAQCRQIVVIPGHLSQWKLSEEIGEVKNSRKLGIASYVNVAKYNVGLMGLIPKASQETSKSLAEIRKGLLTRLESPELEHQSSDPGRLVSYAVERYFCDGELFYYGYDGIRL